MELTPELSTLSDAWASSITRKLENISLKRAYELFMDQISTGEYGSSAYKAAFSYHCLDRFEKTNIPTTVIATKAGLYEESL